MEAAEADSCGVEVVRVIVNTCGLCRCGVCGVAVEAGGKCQLMEAGVCERGSE